MARLLLHLLMLLAVWPTVLGAAGVEVGLQVTLVNPVVEAPLSLALTEGAVLDAAAAADGTAIAVALPGGAFVGARLDLRLTDPGGAVTTVMTSLDAADLLAGTVLVPIAAAALTADGTYGTAALIVAPDGTGSTVTAGPAFQVDRAPPPPPQVAITGAIGDGVAVPANGTTHDRRPRISGTATPGATVRLQANGASVGATTAAGDGTWSVLPRSDLDLQWQTFVARATRAGSSTDSAEYAVDILGDERDLSVGGCGAGSGIALLLMLTAALGLRGGRRSLGLVLAVLPLVDARSAEEVGEVRDALSLTVLAWPSADASGSTRDDEEIAYASDPPATVRVDLAWWADRARPVASPTLGFGVGYWRSSGDLAPARPVDASYHVVQNNLPFSLLLRWRLVEAPAWGCDAQISVGAGPVLGRVSGSNAGGDFTDRAGTGSVLDGSIAVEPWYRISDGWILGASLRGVLARTDMRFEDRIPGGDDERYRVVQRVRGVAWGAFAAWSW